VPLLLVGDCVGGAYVVLDQRKHGLRERSVISRLQLARLLGSLLRQPDDGIDHRLEMPVAKHYRAKHEIL